MRKKNSSFSMLIVVLIVFGLYPSTTNAQSITADFETSTSLACSVPQTITFTDKSTNPDTWSWNFGDGSTSNVKNPNHAYTTEGVYIVKLTVQDTTYGTSSNISKSIIVEGVTADFSASSTYGCGPKMVTFSDQSSVAGGTIDSWTWDFGDGFTSSLQSPSHTYETPGDYTVKLTITTANGCTKTATKTEYIEVIGPDIGFEATSITITPAPAIITFQDNTSAGSSITSWLWNFGDGSTSAVQNPSHTYTTQGVYDVSLTVADLDGCSRTLTKTNFVNTIPGAYDVSIALYAGGEDRFSVAAQEAAPRALAFNGDGTKMFVLGSTRDDINEYTLSTGFDVSTAVYAGDSERFSVSAEETIPYSLAFNKDGTKMFVMGIVGENINEYTLSTAYDVSTAVYAGDGERFSVAAQESFPYSLAFNGDGTKMFVMGTTGENINEYTLGSAYDVSTAVYAGDGERFSVSAQELNPHSLAFNGNGTKMFVMGTTGDDINEYTLGSAYDVSTATYAGDAERFSVSAQETLPFSLAFNNDGTKMFVMGVSGRDINEYSLAAPVITSAVASQAVNDNETISPFSAITVADPNGDNVSATITLDDNTKGLLTGTGLTGTGPYTLASTDAASLQASLRALVFNPTDNRVALGNTETTTFTLVTSDGTFSDTDSRTTVVSSPVAPTIVWSSLASSPTNAFTITATFSEPVTGFVIGSITVGNGTASDFVATSTSVYTATITPTADGAVTVDAAAGVAQDAGGADNTAATQFSITAEVTAPTGYSVIIDQSPINNSNVAAVSFTFATAEIGTTYSYTFSSDGGGTNVTGTGTITTATDQITGINVSALGDGNITLSVTLTDAVGNTGMAATDSKTKDATLPQIVCPEDQNTDFNTSCQFIIPDYTGLASATDNVSVSSVTQSPAIGTVITANQVITLTATDGNGNTKICTFNVIPADNTKPTITCPADVESCEEIITFEQPTATDNCKTLLVTQTAGLVSGSAFPVGVTSNDYIVTDDNGNTATCSFTITRYPVVEINAGADATINAGFPYTLSPTASEASLFEWSPSEGLDDPFDLITVAQPTHTITYTLLGTSDTGCWASDQITITVNEEIEINNFMSPNGDGKNDFWEIKGNWLLDDCTIIIYNNRGVTLFKSIGYNNDWDGTDHGKSLPQGIYYYTISCPNKNMKKGKITLMK